MDTPICDFVRKYAKSNTLRLHMPGHKGQPILGCEPLDITEIHGADSLFEADGIIRQSEENASRLFGCDTYYSTEGSSLAIRAMLYLAVLHAKKQGKTPCIAAGRNAHKTFLSAAALLDFQVQWLSPESASYLSCPITPDLLEQHFATSLPTAVYVTSPDYLGNCVDIAAIAEVCHRHGVLLLVDNAHGAYLKFLPQSRHPMDLGADICCDSAHKTLPVLTGGAYLHIRLNTGISPAQAKKALSLFGSTSPSYLILQSLDMANRIIAENYRLAEFVDSLNRHRQQLAELGYTLIGNEPLKLTIAAKKYGYTGEDMAQYLRKQCLECEFADPDYLVLMLTPECDLSSVEQALSSLPRRSEITTMPPMPAEPIAKMSIRDATLSPAENIRVEDALGRILASPSVGCPPAVPIVLCGEEITQSAIDAFRYYGIHTCDVVI